MNLLSLRPSLRRALLELYPSARPVPASEVMSYAHCRFFLRDPEKLICTEVRQERLIRAEVPDFLLDLKKIHHQMGGPMSVVLLAPEFEPEVKELLEWVTLPIRIFRYSITDSPEPALRLEEVNASLKIIPPAMSEEFPELPVPERKEPSWASFRLTKEELQEFIQLELELARQ